MILTTTERIRHNLLSIVVIGMDGIMTKEAGKYEGMTREECRKGDCCRPEG